MEAAEGSLSRAVTRFPRLRGLGKPVALVRVRLCVADALFALDAEGLLLSLLVLVL